MMEKWYNNHQQPNIFKEPQKDPESPKQIKKHIQFIRRFYLSENEAAYGQIQMQFLDFWKELVTTAQQHKVSRLLVDLSGNPGGFVDLAYLFVRAIHPQLQWPGCLGRTQVAGKMGGGCKFRM